MLIRLNGARGHGGRRGDSEWVVGLSHHSSSSASSFYSPSSSWRGEETSSEWMMVLSWSDGSPWEPHDGRPFHLPPVPHEYSTETWVSHIHTRVAYTQQEKNRKKQNNRNQSFFFYWVGLVPYLELLGGSCLKKHSVNILSPFLRNLSAAIFMDSRQRGNGGTQIAGKFLRDVLDSFRKARQKIHSLC